jgi:DNA gyrase subunit B
VQFVLTKKYDSSSIKKLEFPENVRTRPTMYIGELGKVGIFQLLREIVDNSIDEFMNGFATKIQVKVNPSKGTFEVSDDGRGIPVDNNALEMVLCNLHAGGKFGNNSYSISSGLNGVGASCVNALSDFMKVTVNKDGYQWYQEFSKGRKKTDLQKIKKTKKQGTITLFKPDETIFGTNEIDVEEIKGYLFRQSYIHKNLYIYFEDQESGHSDIYHHENGIFDMVSDTSTDPLFKDTIYFTVEEKTDQGTISVELAFKYDKDDSDTTVTFCNGIETVEGGTHLQGFRMGLATIVKNYIADHNIMSKKDIDSGLEIIGDDVREGLVAVISVKHPNPKYHSQTKQKLTNTEVQGIIMRLMNSELTEYLNNNSGVASLIAKKVVAAAKGRIAGKAARERVQRRESQSFISINNIGKLADCSEKDPLQRELFIVEGDSAGGSAKEGRDVKRQAVYALKGKPLNTFDTSLQKMYDNKEISDLIQVIGTGIDSEFNLEKLKYNKIIIMADADVDGYHIGALLLTFFFKHARELIENGHIFIAKSPLYRIQRGSKFVYFVDDNEYEKYIRKLIVKSFKVGLSMNNEIFQLSDMEFRKLLRLSKGYIEKMSLLINQYGISKRVLTLLIENNNPDSLEVNELWKKEWVYNSLQSLGLTCKQNKTSLSVQGFCDGVFHDFEINEDFCKKTIECLNIFYSTLNGYEGFYYEEDEKGFINSSLLEMLERFYTKCTPKSRNRLKGLGESDPQELWETTMNPETRTLIQVNIDDFEKADSVVFDLMGNNPERRRIFLESFKENKVIL